MRNACLNHEEFLSLTMRNACHQSYFDQLIRFEKIRRSSELAYAQHPLDVDNLTEWGRSLYELSRFHDSTSSKMIMTDDAILKLEVALAIDPLKHRALWCLGMAHLYKSKACFTADQAKDHFDRAYTFFKSALAQDPDNDTYQKSVEDCSKRKKSNYKLMTSDMFGWVIIAVGLFAWTRT